MVNISESFEWIGAVRFCDGYSVFEDVYIPGKNIRLSFRLPDNCRVFQADMLTKVMDVYILGKNITLSFRLPDDCSVFRVNMLIKVTIYIDTESFDIIFSKV